MTSFPCHKIWDHPNFSWTSENSNLIKHTSLKVVWLWVTFHGFHDFSLWCSWLVTKPPLKKKINGPEIVHWKGPDFPCSTIAALAVASSWSVHFFVYPQLFGFVGWNGNHLSNESGTEGKVLSVSFHFGASTHWTCHSLMIISFFDKKKNGCARRLYICVGVSQTKTYSM